MALFPGELIPWVQMTFVDEDGQTVIGGKLYSYEAGTSTPQPTYTDADLAVPHPNPIILDSAGRPESPIYLLATGYSFTLTDADDVQIWEIDSVENVGAAFAATFGLTLGSGSKNVTSGFQILVSDRLVTVESTGGPNPCVVTLLPVADATQPITIKNVGTVPVTVTASGTDKVDLNATTFTLPAATALNLPTITLVPYPPSDWLILSSYGL